MTEPQKSAAGITDSKKKSPEHDNEPDLLDSWRSSVRGNDVLDFSAEAVPRERKKVFDFGKLDVFELDAEFGNMPSFKMDMSDLDFSSPLKKTEKSKLGKDATPGKLEGKKDKFSFSFDFNELDAFDLDTNLLKGEKNPKNCSESDLLDCHENDVSRLPKLGGTNSSNSKDLVSSKGDLDTTNVSTSSPADVVQSNISQEDALTLREKQITSTQGEGKTSHSDGERDFHVEYPFTTGSEKANAQTCGPDFLMQTCDSSPKESIQQSQNAVPSLATLYVYSGEEKHSTSMISGDNSQSGIKSHAYGSKGLSAPYTGESISTVNTPEENQSDQKNIGQICVIMHQSDWKNVDQNSIIFHESPEMHKDVEDNSEGPLLNETLTSKSKEDKQRSSSKVLKSSLHRNSRSEQLIATKEENNGLKLLSLHKSLANGSRASSATTLKQLFADLHPTKEKREHSGDNEQTGNRTLKVGQNVVGGDSNHEDTNCSHGMQRPVSSTATVDTTQVASIENRGISLQRTDNRPNLSNMNISRIARSNKCLSNSFVKETKSVAILKESMVKHPKISPLAAHSVNKEETVHSQPLKRKLIEASHMDLVTSNSSKRILESPRERKSLQISPKTKEQVGAESEAVGGFDSDIYLDRWNSVVDEYVDGKPMSPGVPMTIENDGNVQKALACAKELENICNMLKKKHKEAKELLIRALVNSNSLLMLDHPIREEKILALQNFAAALLLKKYDV